MDQATIYLPHASMGIVGMGGIGCEIARRALAFGMSVRGVDRFPDRIRPPEGVESVEAVDRLPELLRLERFRGDRRATYSGDEGWFDARTLAHLRPTSFLINIGRGAIVVLDDLVAALRARRWPARPSTSTRSSPCPPDHPLWDFPNVILTPHTAGYSPVIAERHLAMLVENVGRFARANRS